METITNMIKTILCCADNDEYQTAESGARTASYQTASTHQTQTSDYGSVRGLPDYGSVHNSFNGTVPWSNYGSVRGSVHGSVGASTQGSMRSNPFNSPFFEPSIYGAPTRAERPVAGCANLIKPYKETNTWAGKGTQGYPRPQYGSTPSGVYYPSIGKAPSVASRRNIKDVSYGHRMDESFISLEYPAFHCNVS
jgi:hypothetical protein